MAQTSFILDDKTTELLKTLQVTFGVSTNAAVIRLSLALANIAARHAGVSRTIVIKGDAEGDDKKETVILAG